MIKKTITLLLILMILTFNISGYAIDRCDAQQYIGQRVEIKVYVNPFINGIARGIITCISQNANGEEYIMFQMETDTTLSIYPVYLDTIAWIRLYKITLNDRPRDTDKKRENWEERNRGDVK